MCTHVFLRQGEKFMEVAFFYCVSIAVHVVLYKLHYVYYYCYYYPCQLRKVFSGICDFVCLCVRLSACLYFERKTAWAINVKLGADTVHTEKMWGEKTRSQGYQVHMWICLGFPVTIAAIIAVVADAVMYAVRRTLKTGLTQDELAVVLAANWCWWWRVLISRLRSISTQWWRWPRLVLGLTVIMWSLLEVIAVITSALEILGNWEKLGNNSNVRF